jgi:hypothetical protein
MKLAEWEWESKHLRASSILCPFEFKPTTSIAMPAKSCSGNTYNTYNKNTNVNILSNLKNIKVDVGPKTIVKGLKNLLKF